MHPTFLNKLSFRKKKKKKTVAPVSSVSPPSQNTTQQHAASSTAINPLSELWAKAVEKYQQSTGNPLPCHFVNLDPQVYSQRVEKHFDDFRNEHKRLRKIIRPFCDIILTVSSVVGHALKLDVYAPAEAICGAVVVLLQAARQVSRIYDEIADLLEDLHYLLERAYSYTRGTLEAGMERLILDNLVCTLEILGIANKLVAKGRVKLFLRTLIHKEKKITDSLGKLERLSKRENHTVNATMLSMIGGVMGVMKESIQDGREHFNTVKQALAKIDAAAHVLGEISKELQETRNDIKSILIPIEEQARKQKLKQLRPSLSLKSTHKECLKGTRKSIIHELEDWSIDTSAPNVLWVYGHPGTGKSTIATTFNQFLAGEKMLGASCFFSRQGARKISPRTVWRAIAHDLASKRPFLGHVILQQLDKVDLDDASPAKIFQALIEDPLRTELAGSKEPLVIVVDALDEYCWDTEHYSLEASQTDLISELLTCWKTLPSNVKLFVTSREQSHIVKCFNTDSASWIRLRAGTTVPPESEAAKDIKTYFEYQFYNLASLSYVEVTKADVDALTAAAAGLFIWATTVIAIATKPGRFDPIMDQVRHGKFGGATTSAIGQLYRAILATECSDCPELFVLVAGTIIVAREPLSCVTLSRLLDRKENDIAHLASRLRPILHSGSTLQFIHKSFVDYVTTNSNSTADSTCPYEFICDIKSAEKQLAQGCFETMKRELHFNMGNLLTSHCFNSEYPESAKDLPKDIIYACHFWYSHLDGYRYLVPFCADILLLLKKRLLLWLEVLSLTGMYAIAAPALNGLIRLAQIKPDHKEIAMRSRDALSFIRTFASAIDASYPQIYLSAIPLAPRLSMTRMQYLPLLKNSYIIASGISTHWPRSLAVLQGHEWSINSVAFSPNGRLIVSGSGDHTIRIWNAETHVQVGEPLLGHEHWVISVAFSPNGRQIVSCSNDCTVRVWDVETHVQVEEPFRGHRISAQTVTFSPNNKWIASGCRDGTIRVWDLGTRNQLGEPLQGHEDPVNSVAFSSDGQRIVSGSDDKTIRVWSTETRFQIGKPLQGHEGHVKSVAFSPNGHWIVSGSSDCTIRIWDAEMHEQVYKSLEGHSSDVFSVAFSLDGQRIVSGSKDRTVRLWDVETDIWIGEILQGHERAVFSVAFSSDGQRIVSGSGDRTVRVWDAESRAEPGEPLQGHEGSIRSIALSPDGRRIAYGSYEGNIQVWGAGTHEQIGKPLQGHQDWVHSIAFSPDGKCIVSGSSDMSIRIWDTETHSQVGKSLEGHKDSVCSVAFSSDGQRIVSSSKDKTIRLWNVETHEQIAEPLKGHDEWVESVSFSIDGRRIVSGSWDCTVRIWNAETHSQIGTPLHGHKDQVESVAFSPNGRHIVSGSFDHTVRMWDVEDHVQLGEPLQGHQDWVHSVAFSPDGRWIASGSRDKTIRVWDVKTHAQLGEPLQGYGESIYSVAFSSDGQKLISGSRDHTARVWDMRSIIQTAKKEIKDSQAPKFPYRAVISTYSANPDILPKRVYLKNDGWIVSPSGESLLWIPPYLRRFVQTEHCLDIVGSQPMVALDFSQFKHGNSWTECWKEASSS